MRTHTQQLRSSINCKRALKAHVLSFVSLFITIFAILIPLVAPVQLTGGGQPSAKPKVVPTAQDASPPLFLSAVAYDSGGYDAASVAVVDVNGDGKQDVIVANACGSSTTCKYYRVGFEGTVAVLLGNGDGTFQPAVAYASGGETPVSVAVADVNGDGKPDIIVANKCASGTNCKSGNGSVGIMMGNGDGTFEAVATYNSGGSFAVSLAVADFNGDGKPDLAVAHSYGANRICCHSPALGVLLGNGNGTFQPAVMYGGGGQTSVAVGDVNGDHRPDLVVSSPPSNLAGNGVEIFLGKGDGTFQTPTVYDTGSPFSYSVAIADLNGDGKLDLVVDHGVTNAGQDSLLGILLGNGDGTFQGVVIYDSGVHAAGSVAVSDVDGDGRPDLLLASDSGLGVLLGNGDGTFQPALTYGSGGSPATSVAAAEVNGDGKPDLVTGNVYGGSNSEGAVGVLLNNTTEGKSTTSTALTSSLSPATYGQKVTWTATVTSSGSIMPTGTVRFKWQSFTETFTIGSTILNSSGVAILTRSNLNADPYPLTAVYMGDAANSSSTSAVLNQVVLQATSSARLASSLNPSAQSQAVTFTATISSPTVRPTGPVTFKAGTTVLGTAQLSGGKAALTISSLSVGSTKVTATYYGNSNISKSSASVIQTVQ